MSEHAPVRLSGVASGYGQRLVLNGLDLELRRGTFTAIVGPNGSGKSTAIRAMSRLLPVRRGVVFLDGRDVRAFSSRHIARRVAVLPQAPSGPPGLTVRELVEMGRFPHSGLFGRLGEAGHRAIEEALELTRLAELAERPLDELSGGERQRAWVALALAQGADTLLLDEPITFLDVRHQFEVLDLLRSLQRDRGMTIVVVLHDLLHAATYADRVIVMEGGRIVADGTPASVLTVDVLARVFGVAARIFIDPESGRSVCLPVGPSMA